MIRWHSTLESSDAGEPSVLAIVETLVVSAISYWIAWRWGTVQHIAIGACVAPLLLLRTEMSQQLAFRWVESLVHPVMALGEKTQGRAFYESLWGLVFVIVVPLMITFVKITATVTATISRPVQVFRAIPTNWNRVALALDLTVQPEPLPGVHRLDNATMLRSELLPVLRFRPAMEGFADSVRKDWYSSPFGEMLGASALLGLFLLLVYIPAFLYRWSLKASALIYAPLLYVVDEARKDEENPQGRLNYYGRSATQRVIAIYSIIVVVAFSAKWYLLVHWPGFKAWWNGSNFWLTLGTLVEPRYFTWWQIGQVINAGLALGVFGYSWHLLQRSDAGLKIELPAANRNLSILFCVRAVLTIYVLFCTIYLTINGWKGFILPPIDDGFFPRWRDGKG